jgi:uncharacterized protein
MLGAVHSLGQETQSAGLDEVECRVLGCLVEKELATPHQYPLTLNALVLACNQTTNRDPVVSYPEDTVRAAVTALKERGLARFVHPSHGRSAVRFRHALRDELGLDQVGSAVLAVLMLRGPQTPGELRSRTERMAPLADVAQVEDVLGSLASRPVALVRRLPRGPGQKEERYVHLLGNHEAATSAGHEAPTSAGHEAATSAGHEAAPSGSQEATTTQAPIGPRSELDGPRTELDALREEIRRLRAEVDELRHDLDRLQSDLGS